MFAGAFSFHGRIGRLNFFLNGLLAGLGFAVGMAVLVLAVLPARHDGLGLAAFAVLLAVLLVVLMWFHLSLYVRRIRDIGWDPVVVIVGWIAFNLLDVVLARIVPALAVGEHGARTVIAPLVNFALSMAILFVPGRSGADDGGSSGRFDDPLPGSDTRVVAGYRSGFGRRETAMRR